jgi:poly-gamma-glutamate synthesis protein (capsule biosynthesis protein)
MWLVSLIILGGLAACQSSYQSGPDVSSPISTIPESPSPSLTLIQNTEAPPAPSPPFSVKFAPQFPEMIINKILASQEFVLGTSKDTAEYYISVDQGFSIGSWIYIVVAPLTSSKEQIAYGDLLSHWESGDSLSIDNSQINLSEETYTALRLLWGDPNPEGLNIVNQDAIFPVLWSNPESVAILPFEQLNPYWKVISIDGQSPLAPDFDQDQYPLFIPIKISSTSTPAEESIFNSTFNNFDQSLLTTVALTGVTALVRDTAAIMEEKGMLYPAGDIQSILVNADITHINNEVPFSADCPVPDSNQDSLRFCSKDEYIELLEFIGTDIVELSGDHFGDWGTAAMLHTLDLYRDRNWLTYGGGATYTEGLQPVFIEHNGNKIAFIGCNGKGPERYATATDTNPGASRCDFDWMEIEISRLKELGYLVIATMQHEEVDSFQPIAIQQRDFRRLANAGAVIVSGSQAHHPQSIEISTSSFIHYGLGNLFFDQWYLAQNKSNDDINKDKAFIDLHVFYDGRHINTQLIPIQFIDNARPRLMNADERGEFLPEVFKTSIWNIQK